MKQFATCYILLPRILVILSVLSGNPFGAFFALGTCRLPIGMAGGNAEPLRDMQMLKKTTLESNSDNLKTNISIEPTIHSASYPSL